MSIWDSYPADYRATQVQRTLAAVCAGECVSLVGLSGSGKSNLMGFLAQRGAALLPCEMGKSPTLVLVDCNRLSELSPQAFFRLLLARLDPTGDVASASANPLADLEAILARRITQDAALCLLLDRFDALQPLPGGQPAALQPVWSNLRALRDTHKYRLTYVTATRRLMDPLSELAELFYANTLWLGPLSASDARWSAQSYARRKNLDWDVASLDQLATASWGYPALLRAACEAYAAGCPLDLNSLANHPAVRRRVEEFWADQPGEDDLRASGLEGHPFLLASRMYPAIDPAHLTAKEHLLWIYFQEHPQQVCEKDDLIRAVWPEDRIFERGIRDDSLAQLVRRLREKIESDPSAPRYIQTIPGRGYRYTPG